ncbi:hypothetical protein KEM52_000887 [Ascosphaera acerosa]|nr:hypothetical protein KEM52_000887 [Ascosphaera acerosa]
MTAASAASATANSASSAAPASPRASAEAAAPSKPAPTSNAPASATIKTSAGPQANAPPPPKSGRRPSRKSTLTQQQKNHRRQRATQDQLVTLEMEFNKNPTPTAAVRERIAEEINMTERSVQIWFQNRRAKIKMIAKKGIESGEDCDAIPESMRQYLALGFDYTTPCARNLLAKAAGFGTRMPSETSSGKTMIIHFTCQTLRIGKWRRIGQNFMDLVVFCSPDKASMTYYIHNDSAGYKIEYPFSAIRNILLTSPDAKHNVGGSSGMQEGLAIELNRPPQFFMDTSNSGGFHQCEDFTEDHEGTNTLVHHLGGPAKTLSAQLARLLALESFRNRHYPTAASTGAGAGYSHPYIAAPAPISPAVHDFVERVPPQSHEFPQMRSRSVSQQHYLGAELRAPRGHKRQRSRSVPTIPVNIVHALQPQSMPPPFFPVQPPHSSHTQYGTPTFPAHPHPGRMQSLAGHLQIDTSSPYPVHTHTAFPMSATSASPGFSPFFTAPPPPPPPAPAAHHMDGFVTGPQYSMSYFPMSPMTEASPANIAHFGSPLSHVSPSEQAFSDQLSPTMLSPTGYQHSSTTATMYPYSTRPDHTPVVTGPLQDNNLVIQEVSDMYSKQTLDPAAAPIPSPLPDTAYTPMSFPMLSPDEHTMTPQPQHQRHPGEVPYISPHDMSSEY